jgi:hypothetical protein
MSTVFRLFQCLIPLLSTGVIFAEGTLHHIRGDVKDPGLINIVFLSEGYTANLEQTFLTNITDITDGMFSMAPYKQYSSYFNVWGIFVPSQENGADHPQQNVFKNTFFGATFNSSIERLVTFNNYSKAYDLLAENLPDYDIVGLLVNDAQYGGSGGQIVVATTNSFSQLLVMHEIGHSFAQLRDEYEEEGERKPVESYNITAFTARDQIPWKNWILAQTPLPTPETVDYSKVVGLFEGAMYQSKGWYRPKLQCTMRSLDTSFCEVCIEAHVFRFYSHISPIKNWSPHDTELVYSDKQTVFSIEMYEPNPNTMDIAWSVDSTPIRHSKTLSLKELPLIKGKHKIFAIVKDTTSLVRGPLTRKMLIDTINWNVEGALSNDIVKRNALETTCPTAYVLNTKLFVDNLQNSQNALNVALYSVQGKLILSKIVQGSSLKLKPFQVSLRGMGCGIYMVSIREKRPAGEVFNSVFSIINNK